MTGKVWWILGWNFYDCEQDNFISSFTSEDEAENALKTYRQLGAPWHTSVSEKIYYIKYDDYEIINISASP